MENHMCLSKDIWGPVLEINFMLSNFMLYHWGTSPVQKLLRKFQKGKWVLEADRPIWEI